jgi:site-specific DNA-cytosine methylase
MASGSSASNASSSQACSNVCPASIEPSQILDGSYLGTLAKEHAAAFSSVIVPVTPPETTLLWGTICSGGEVLLFTMKELHNLYVAMGFKLRFVHRFSCEIKPALQAWIFSVNHEVGTSADGAETDDMKYCLFERAEDMGKSVAKCVRHNKLCIVPNVDLLMMGTSCKDISRASSAYRADMLVMSMQSSIGGSAQTFCGAEAYMLQHIVQIFLFENVDALDDAGDLTTHVTNLSVVDGRLEKCGFALKTFLMDTVLFGLPQSRRRYYIIGLKESAAAHFDFSSKSASQVLGTVENLVRLCQRTPPCASMLLLGEDDCAIDDELNRRLAMGEKGSKYNVSAAISQFQGAGLSWGAVDARSGTQDTLWYDTLTKLQRNVLTYSEAECKDAMFRDIGQSSSRVRYSQAIQDKHTVFCQMPGQLVWVRRPEPEKLPRLQVGREALTFQGYPIAQIPTTISMTSEKVMQEIAGNMMSAPVTLALLQSLFAALPWRPSSHSKSTQTTERDVDEALAVFNAASSSNPASDDVSPRVKRLRRLRIRPNAE